MGECWWFIYLLYTTTPYKIIYIFLFLANNVQIGNIVQIQRDNSDWYHSVIISDYDNATKEYCDCGHTKNKEDEPISSIGIKSGYKIIRF